MSNCELCGSTVREGDYGQSTYICDNKVCERSDPDWAYKKRSEILKPFLEKIEKYSSFSQGTIDFHDARWVGDGSAEITLKDGTEFMCHVKQGKFNPFDFSHFEELEININESTVKEIKENMLKLINLREKMRKAIKAGIK
ncbi:hypothetical protein P9Y62_01950 [Bacillus thuringiensis]|uniref:hypothetical protein n=1 Tax=Bacillus thuringiensis TaxID=1428 RepID=UPI0001A1B893|nr:hypothetical protein [Bacillus thuringiensis]EEM38091.1 hypothetical protein bthur0004_60870 [Bacillus thuringiensis serovar sotto str. T04001]MEB4895212.1 hypothetical protein [Bacillus thuringiensis]MEC2724316.1 hypothetical protein [Bacillus thuringiensis]MEC2747042.1 hypothetical protein [Bacillus thuringiensis]MEC2768167.1 hypothetical protein [Bacillus thuringiensis]